MSTQATGEEKYERSSRPAIVNVVPISGGHARPQRLSGDGALVGVVQALAARQVHQKILDHDVSVADDHDLLADVEDLAEDVRGEHDGPVGRQALDEVQHLVDLPR